MSTIINQPADLIYVGQPVIFKVATNSTMEKLHYLFNDIDGKTLLEGDLTSIAYNGYVTFDLQTLLTFPTTNLKNNPSLLTSIGTDPYTLIKCNVAVVDTDKNCSFKVLRGVKQINDSDISNFKGKFLTDYSKLERYDGFPLYVSVLPYKDLLKVTYNSSYITRNYTEKADIELNDGCGDIVSYNGDTIRPLYLTNNFIERITDNNLNPIIFEAIYENSNKTKLDSKTVTCECVPNSPVYLRWLNKYGGIDCMMFSNAEHVVEGSLNEFYKPYYEEISDSNKNNIQVSWKTTNNLVIERDGLSKDQIKAVSFMPFSSSTQIYLTDKNKWMDVLVSKSSNNYMLGDYTNKFTTTIQLPDINTEY